MIKLIIFDYDGVIVDSFKAHHEVYKVICKKLGKECPKTFEDFKRVYGSSYIELLKNLKFSEEDKASSEDLYKEEIIKQELEAYEGIVEVIKELSKKYKLAVATRTYRENTMKELKRHGILNYFFRVIAKEKNEVADIKKSEAIIDFMKKLDLKGDEVILIGDREVDYKDAKEAGIKHVILVEYGWGYNKHNLRKHKQEVIVENPRDILKAVSSLK